MKKLYLFYVLFIVTIANGQQYVFNTLTKYSFNDDVEIVSYTNSNDETYYLKLFRNDNAVTARLTDAKNKQIHFFKVIEIVSNEGTSFDLVYDKSSDLNHNKNEFTKHIYDFKTVETKDSISKVTMTVYDNPKKKKIIKKYDLEVKKSKDNHFPAFRQLCIHPYEAEKRMNIPENGVVISAKGNLPNGNVAVYKLKEIKPVNIQLLVTR